MSFSVKGLNQAWDQILTIKKIDKILKILELLDPIVSNTILRKFSKRMSKDNPFLYDELIKQMMDPLKVMEQLDRKDVGMVWKSIGLDDQEILASRIDSGLLHALGINPDRYLEEIEVKEKDYLKCVRRFYDSFYDLQDQGYIRPLELPENHIRVPGCYHLDEMFEEKIRIVQKDPVLRLGGAIQVFMFEESTDHTSCGLELIKVDDSGSRSKESATVNFDSTGFALWNSTAVTEPGLYEIVLTKEQKDEKELLMLGRCPVLVVETEKKCFSFHHEETECIDGKTVVNGQLLFQNSPATADVSAQLVCGCGNVIDETWAHVKDGALQLEVDVSDHQGPFFIIISSMKTSIQGFIPLFEDHASDLKVPTAFVKSKKIAEELNRFPVSIRHRDPQKLVNGLLIAGGPSNLLSHLNYQIGRGMGLTTFSKGQFKQLNNRLNNQFYSFKLPHDVPETQVFQVNNLAEWKQTIAFNTTSIPAFWQVMFVHIKSKGQYSILEKKIPTPENILSSHFPEHVLPGDVIEGSVYYHTRKPLELSISQQGQSNHKRLMRSGRVPIMVSSGSELAMEAADSNEKQWTAEWQNRPFKKMGSGLKIRPRLVRKGETFQMKNGFLFPDMKHWILHTAGNLLNYPCRCAEQTSSIIGGLLIIRALQDQGLSPEKYPLVTLDEMLDKEIHHLSSMQHSSGRMTLWRPTGDPPDYTPFPGLGIVVLDNLRRLGSYSSETGKRLLNNLKGYFKRSGKNPYNNDLEKTFLQYRLKQEGREDLGIKITDIIRENIMRNNNGFHVSLHDHYKYGPYFMGVVLEILHQTGLTSLEFTSSKNKYEKREKGIWVEMLDRFHIRDLKREDVTEKSYGRAKDPVYFILDGLMKAVGSDGYWGTNSTVKILESLLQISNRRSFDGSFLVQGRNEPYSPDGITEIKKKQVQVVSDEAIIAEIEQEDTINDILELDIPPASVISGGILLQRGDTPLELGSTYPMSIDLTSKAIPNPMLDIFQSGYLKFDSFAENASVDEHRLTIAANDKLTLPVTATRRGNGRLLCKITDMYNPAIAYRMEVPLEVV